MAGKHEGGCLCGAIRYTVDGPMREIVACHCGQCRRQTGLYYAATDAPDSALEVRESGALAWYRSSPSARRGFCSVCGSALFWKSDGSDKISILAGSLDMPSGLRIASHIFVADKADFYDITDGLPQHSLEPRWRK